MVSGLAEADFFFFMASEVMWKVKGWAYRSGVRLYVVGK